MSLKKPIHLLYVPTIFCNMGCRYCYLGELTEEKMQPQKAVDTLRYAIENFTQNGYIPYNLSFHGGEVTTLPIHILEELFALSRDYYDAFTADIRSMGFDMHPLHIKTNLFNFHKIYDLCDKYEVSISGSVDLPLRLHEKYRVDKQGNSTLEQIQSNLKLLASYPHRKKISCVVTKEHLDAIDEFIQDIKYIHHEIGLDMSRFNVMFSFDSYTNQEKFGGQSNETAMLTHDEQVEFYEKIFAAFKGSELDKGMREEWFKEFTPDYCCSAANCGDKFFLLQSDGEVYSCPRGQSSTNYRYGNIFKQSIESIIESGFKTIERNENRLDIDEECKECLYFPYCNLGCTFVREQTQEPKSYTCKLQKAIYRNNPKKYPPYTKEEIDEHIKFYIYRNKFAHAKELKEESTQSVMLTEELYEESNSLVSLIESDRTLQHLYSDTLFVLAVNEKHYRLSSQILKNRSEILLISPQDSIALLIHKDALTLAVNPQDIANNTLHMMLLRATPVVYGDEQRMKQEHIFDHSIYTNALINAASLDREYYRLDITELLHINRHHFKEDIKNNLFFTTKGLRDYHYTKQKKNAFYHIQAINLPFANIEFYWIGE